MQTIHERLQSCIEQSGKSIRAVAIESGVPYSRLHSALKNNRAISFKDMISLSSTLGARLDDLAGLRPSTQATVETEAEYILNTALSLARRRKAHDVGRVSLDDFLDWWHANSGRLENFDTIRPHVDLFNPPPGEARRILPSESGSKSLATVCFHVEATDHLIQTLDGFSEELNRDLVRAHIQALKANEPVLTHPSIDEVLPNGERFKKTYRRILAPVLNKEGKRLIANFSQEIVAGRVNQE